MDSLRSRIKPHRAGRNAYELGLPAALGQILHTVDDDAGFHEKRDPGFRGLHGVVDVPVRRRRNNDGIRPASQPLRKIAEGFNAVFLVRFRPARFLKIKTKNSFNSERLHVSCPAFAHGTQADNQDCQIRKRAC